MCESSNSFDDADNSSVQRSSWPQTVLEFKFLSRCNRRVFINRVLLTEPNDIIVTEPMAEQAERAFARTFLNTLSTQPITYADDYQQPSQHSLKRVPVLPVSF